MAPKTLEKESCALSDMVIVKRNACRVYDAVVAGFANNANNSIDASEFRALEIHYRKGLALCENIERRMVDRAHRR